jgi:hypothetical protein
VKITDEAVEAALDVLMDDGHNGIECRPDRNFEVSVRAALTAALPHLEGATPTLGQLVESIREKRYIRYGWQVEDLAKTFLAMVGEGATPAIDRDALADTIQEAMSGTVNRDNMTERSDTEQIADAVMALICGGTASPASAFRGVYEAAASLQTAEDIATIVEEYADDLEPPTTVEWLELRDWFKGLLHEVAARAREIGGAS